MRSGFGSLPEPNVVSQRQPADFEPAHGSTLSRRTREQRLRFRMPANVVAHIRAGRKHLEPFFSRMLESRVDEPGRDASTFEGEWHFGVEDPHHVAFDAIIGTRKLAVDGNLETMGRFVVPDIECAC